MDWTSIITTVLSVIFGGLITAYFSRRYYLKASEDLTNEVEKSRNLTIMLMRLLDQADAIPVKWDKDGNPLMSVVATSPPLSTLFRKTSPKKADTEHDAEDSHD